jgi:hypothetical protein
MQGGLTELYEEEEKSPKISFVIYLLRLKIDFIDRRT